MTELLLKTYLREKNVTEFYQYILDIIEGEGIRSYTLRQIMLGHGESLNVWSEYFDFKYQSIKVRSFSSPHKNNLKRIEQIVAKLPFGAKKIVFYTLKQDEKKILKSYQTMLETTDKKLKHLLENNLIPRQQIHIKRLAALIKF